MCSFCQGSWETDFAQQHLRNSHLWIGTEGCFWAATPHEKKQGPKETQLLNSSFREKMANECFIVILFWKAPFPLSTKTTSLRKPPTKHETTPKRNGVKSSNYLKSCFFWTKKMGKVHFPDPNHHHHDLGWRGPHLSTARWYYKHWRMVHGATPASRPGSTGTQAWRFFSHGGRCEVFWKAVHGEYDIIYAYYQEYLKKNKRHETKIPPPKPLGGIAVQLVAFFLKPTKFGVGRKELYKCFHSPRRSYRSCHPSSWPEANKLLGTLKKSSTPAIHLFLKLVGIYLGILVCISSIYPCKKSWGVETS